MPINKLIVCKHELLLLETIQSEIIMITYQQYLVATTNLTTGLYPSAIMIYVFPRGKLYVNICI